MINRTISLVLFLLTPLLILAGLLGFFGGWIEVSCPDYSDTWECFERENPYIDILILVIGITFPFLGFMMFPKTKKSFK